MKNNIYIIDTSSLLEIFKNYPVDMHPSFWAKFSNYFDELLNEDRIRIVNYVYDEIVHAVGDSQGRDPDDAELWLKERKKSVINIENISILSKVKDILSVFPNSADIEKRPPAADPFLVAFALDSIDQHCLPGFNPHYIIVTQEKENRRYTKDQLHRMKKPIETIRGLRTICDYYGIESMDYMTMFRTENWRF